MKESGAKKLIHNITPLLLEHITGKFSSGPRTFGFEYEFLSKTPLDLSMMEQLYEFLPGSGFERETNCFRHKSGMSITFEPGGQIEYNSAPLLPEDTGGFEASLAVISRTNMDIEKGLGITYIPVDYIPGRIDVPLCLDSERYRFLHDRMSLSGTRGREMMKASASIHLHVVIRNREEFVPLFLELCKMSVSDNFKMGRERRDIWDNTDPSRCGLPYKSIDGNSTPIDLIRELVTVAAHADILGENVPFWKAADTSFDNFLYHFTTMFTDVRLNNKGPTLELRTVDSVPAKAFRSIWERFHRALQ
jgi:gamma-glutamylcysteine synthetase